MEEFLKSVDYDVWKCPDCNHHTLLSYTSWSSSTKKCPQCRYKTVKVKRMTLSAPTYTSTGKDRIIKNCQHCKYHNETVVTLPKLQRSNNTDSSRFGGGNSSFDSSSSSSSRFGDIHSNSCSGSGSSSGDGASGDW